MSLGKGTGVLLLIFMMHAAIFIGIPEQREVSYPFIRDFGMVDIDISENLTAVNTDNVTLENLNITSGSSSISGGYSLDYNPLNPIFGFFTFLWSFLTAPFALLVLDMPWQVKLLFIVPLASLYLLALISFLRGSEL